MLQTALHGTPYADELAQSDEFLNPGLLKRYDELDDDGGGGGEAKETCMTMRPMRRCSTVQRMAQSSAPWTSAAKASLEQQQQQQQQQQQEQEEEQGEEYHQRDKKSEITSPHIGSHSRDELKSEKSEKAQESADATFATIDSNSSPSSASSSSSTSFSSRGDLSTPSTSTTASVSSGESSAPGAFLPKQRSSNPFSKKKKGREASPMNLLGNRDGSIWACRQSGSTELKAEVESGGGDGSSTAGGFASFTAPASPHEKESSDRSSIEANPFNQARRNSLKAGSPRNTKRTVSGGGSSSLEPSSTPSPSSSGAAAVATAIRPPETPMAGESLNDVVNIRSLSAAPVLVDKEEEYAKIVPVRSGLSVDHEDDAECLDDGFERGDNATFSSSALGPNKATKIETQSHDTKDDASKAKALAAQKAAEAEAAAAAEAEAMREMAIEAFEAGLISPTQYQKLSTKVFS